MPRLLCSPRYRYLVFLLHVLSFYFFSPRSSLGNDTPMQNSSIQIQSTGREASEWALREQLPDRGVPLRVLLEDLGDGHLKVLPADVDSALSEGVHT